MSTGHTETLEMGALAGLISQLGGVISGLERLGPELTRSGDTVTLARLGEVGALRERRVPGEQGALGEQGAWASRGRGATGRPRSGSAWSWTGSGAMRTPGASARIATADALERYAAAVGDERGWVVESAVEMGGDGIDPSDVARCSTAELDAPGVPVTPFSDARPMRWARGWSLCDGREVWVPAVMSHLGVAPGRLRRALLAGADAASPAGPRPPAGALGRPDQRRRSGLGLGHRDRDPRR